MQLPVASRTGLALGSVVLLACLTGCAGEGAPRTEPAPPTSSGSGSPSASGSGSSSPSSGSGRSPTVADPEHAVPPPGPRQKSLLSADILVFSQDTLEDEWVEQVEQVEGVTGVERVSMAQVPIEDRAYDVVAVDPGGYRRFTQPGSADALEVWERIAGGEVAVDPSHRKKLVPDDSGYLTLGATEQAASIHVGAWAPQIEGAVDLVVNERWGEAMGMTPDNALIISTSKTAPDRVAKPLRRLAPEGVSVQRLDVVARLGLDPEAAQNAVVVGSIADAVGTYRYTVSGGQVTPDPDWVESHIVTEQVPILGSVTCNKAMMPQLRAALREVADRGLADKIHPDEYAGCYYPRFIAGTSSLSNHAFGLALDINVPGNQRGTAGEIDRTVVAIFKKWGFTWGGDWNWTDPMHFEMNRQVSPGG